MAISSEEEKVSKVSHIKYCWFFLFLWSWLKFIQHPLTRQKNIYIYIYTSHGFVLFSPPSVKIEKLSDVAWTKIWKCEKRAASGGFQTREHGLYVSFAVRRVKSCFLSFPILSLVRLASCGSLHQLLFFSPQTDGATSLIIFFFPLRVLKILHVYYLYVMII